MKPGGFVLVKNNLFSLDLFRRDKDYFSRQFEPPHHCSYFSKKHMLYLFKQHGFRLVYERPQWVDYLFRSYGFMKRMLNPGMREAFIENKRRRLNPDVALRYSKGSSLGRYLNDKFPPGFVFKKIKEDKKI
jgi:hypothetical protein